MIMFGRNKIFTSLEKKPDIHTNGYEDSWIRLLLLHRSIALIELSLPLTQPSGDEDMEYVFFVYLMKNKIFGGTRWKKKSWPITTMAERY